jgi:hypothetical protein
MNEAKRHEIGSMNEAETHLSVTRFLSSFRTGMKPMAVIEPIIISFF